MQTPASKLSKIEYLASLSESERATLLADVDEQTAESIIYDWRWNGRPSQIIPGTPGAAIQLATWIFWLVLAGRGFGKTRTGAETCREWANDPKARILMIAPTAADVRDVMIEGPGGLLSCYPVHSRPVYFPTRHLIQFPSGAVGITRSADEPERLRGPQFTKFWADELCAWRFPQEAWDQIMFGFRVISPELRGIITTTPKPIKTLKAIVANPQTVTTRGSSYENRANLAEMYYRTVIAPYEGTRLGRQEINAEILEDVPGALWTRGLIEAGRLTLADVRWEAIVRIVIAIDPAVTSNPESDETGIGALGLTNTGHVVILADLSCRETPAGWGKIAVAAYHGRHADRIVAEVNNGGDLVERNIRAIDPSVAFHGVRASRGKYTRAEPVAALYEQGCVHHIGSFPELEDQMCNWTPQGNEKSPDRLDWLVWGVTALLLSEPEARASLTYHEPVEISRY
jgi:phage terminase large subunit-like protein